ncbi:MAG: hypothetical protein TREMPRED_001027 [Tremellales sp. Tagirdzhanova-0007]|nr:MAG: hypothetical protein TREMPRED_001027 [Tremellales sp. Tagirdzhanova-0007]
MSPPLLSTPQEYQVLLDSVDTFLLDCDGVIYHGPIAVKGVRETLRMLRETGKRIIFVTNNASKSRRQYKSTFDKLGIEAKEEEIFGSAYASAVYLSRILKFPDDKKVYVLGESGLEEELDTVGILHTGGTDPQDKVFMTREEIGDIEPDPSVGAVLCGMDINLSMGGFVLLDQKLKEDCHFILTNQDATYPTAGTLWPGSGAMSSPLVYASKREPTVIGKPNKTMMDAIIAEHHFDPKRAIMVGDNLSTDIEFGLNSGVRTLLVMGGVTKRELVYGPSPSSTVPDMVMESFGDFAILAGNVVRQ